MTTWKGYPCKNCILKSTCKKLCFDLSLEDMDDMTKYKVLNNIDDSICLLCGDKIIVTSSNLMVGGCEYCKGIRNFIHQFNMSL